MRKLREGRRMVRDGEKRSKVGGEIAILTARGIAQGSDGLATSVAGHCGLRRIEAARHGRDGGVKAARRAPRRRLGLYTAVPSVALEVAPSPSFTLRSWPSYSLRRDMGPLRSYPR